MKRAIFPGSFDPFHEGHELVLQKSLKDFHFIYIVISWNENKPKRFQEFDQTFKELEQKFKNKKNIKILVNKSKLTVEIARELNCFNFIRGIRSFSDLNYENELREKYLEKEPRSKFFYYWTNNSTSSSKISKCDIIK